MKHETGVDDPVANKLREIMSTRKVASLEFREVQGSFPIVIPHGPDQDPELTEFACKLCLAVEKMVSVTGNINRRLRRLELGSDAHQHGQVVPW